MFKVRAIAYFLGMAAAAGAAEQDLALLARGVSDYERVVLQARPEWKDAVACVQSQAALTPALPMDQQYLAHFRKGICELAAGTLRNSANERRDAVADFQQAIAKWPAVSTGDVVTSAVRVAMAIARAQLGELDAAARDFAAVQARPNCPGTLLMPAFECRKYVEDARLWLAWIQFERGRLDEADRLLAGPHTALKHRVRGILALQKKRYSEAAAEFESALALPPATGMHGLFRPPLDATALQFELGVARLHSGRPEEALGNLQAALKADPGNAQAIFFRGRARELLGRTKEALADYELASRTAFANVGVPFASGYAHYYRGVALFRRKDFRRAESEFVSALNFETADTVKSDVHAWRLMAAVASGSCQASAASLEDALPGTSPLFPQKEARELLAGCRSAS